MEQVISSSILILAIMFIRKFFQKSVSKRLIYAMWLIVAIRLLCPLQLDNSFHILNMMSRSQALLSMKTASVEQNNLDAKHIENVQNVPQVQSELTIQNPSAAQKVLDEQEQSKVQDSSNEREDLIARPVAARQVEWHRILHDVWIAGMMIVFGCLICSNFVFYKRIRKNRRFYQTFENRIQVYETDLVERPCLFGILRPVIYLPTVLLEGMSEDELQMVLVHEYTHYLHKDHIWAMLRCLCVAIYWFNPFVWIASILSKQDCEMACDESVLKRIGEDKNKDYGQMLVKLCESISNHQRQNILVQEFGRGNQNMKKRLNNIGRKSKQKVVSVIAVTILVTATAGCTMGNAGASQKEGASVGLQDSQKWKQTSSLDVADTKPVIETDKENSEQFAFSNNYYNKIKICNGWLYYCDDQTLRKHSIASNQEIEIAEGDFWMGEITDTNLYMLRVPSTEEEKDVADIMCLDLATDQLEKLYAIEENIWGYNPPFLNEENILCCEEFAGEEATCHFYKEVGNHKLQEVKGDISRYQDDSKVPMPGSLNSISTYKAYSCIDYSTNEVDIMSNEGQLLAHFDSEIIDCMFTPKGFVYTDGKMNIHLIDINASDNCKDTVIYSYEDIFVNFATSDAYGIYGYVTNNNNIDIVQLDWNGNLNVLAHETGDKYDISKSRLSAFGGMVAYCWKDEIKLITNEPSKVRTTFNNTKYGILNHQLVKYSNEVWEKVEKYNNVIDIQAGDELSIVTEEGIIEYMGELEFDDYLPNGSAYAYEVAKAAIEFSHTTPLIGIGGDIVSTQLLLLDRNGNVYRNRETAFEQIELNGKKAREVEGSFILLEDYTLLSYDWEQNSVKVEEKH